jgi:hypothetical protein
LYFALFYDQGWSAVEDTLQLAGWEKSRRVVILRRAAKSDLALTRKTKDEQIELLLPEQDVQLWEYAVLITNSSYRLDAIPQLYREKMSSIARRAARLSLVRDERC